MAKNVDRKELRKPDEFVSFWTHVGERATKHRKEVLAGSIAMVVLVVGAMVFSSFSDKRAAGASQALARVSKIASADLLPAEGEAPKTDDDIPRFKTDKERTERALQEADGFISAHGGSPLKTEALLLKAGFLYDLGKYDEAIGLYDQLLGGSLDRRLRFLALEGKGYAFEGKGEVDKAADAFGKLADEATQMGGFYRDRALYHKARLAERKGSTKEAADLYHEILDKIPTTPLREEVSSRLALLENK